MSAPTYAYGKRWRYERAQGRLRMVDAAPVTTHVRGLIASGMSLRGIALAAGVSTTTILRYRDEQYPTTQRAVARRVLAVRPDTILGRHDPEGFVPNIGSRRRIRALLAIGWTHADISAHMPVGARSQVVLHQVGRFVTKATHDAVCAAYDALSMTPGPSDTTRRRAALAGYPPPLAWDDESIDDPTATPAIDQAAPDGGVDHVVITLILTGHPTDTTTAEREQLIPTLVESGLTDGQIADLCHTTDRTIFRTRQRLGVQSRWAS